jgi:hypothetical protein
MQSQLATVEGLTMELHQAVSQIDAIWSQIARTQTFRGYRPATVAVTGVLGLIAAMVQPLVAPTPVHAVDDYILLWVSVAVASVLMVMLELWNSYWRTESPVARRLLRHAVRQFVPCLCAGAAITWAIADFHPQNITLLPGLWALCFSLGVFASLPFVTPSVVWLALYYFLAGSACLSFGRSAEVLSPWVMGGMFGGGQLLMAAALLTSRERGDEPA